MVMTRDNAGSLEWKDDSAATLSGAGARVAAIGAGRPSERGRADKREGQEDPGREPQQERHVDEASTHLQTAAPR